MAKALVFPLAGAAAFWGYLCYYDMVTLYYASNYTFNLNLVQGFEMTLHCRFSTVYGSVDVARIFWCGGGSGLQKSLL